MRNLWRSLSLLLWMTVLTGLAYPLIITGIAELWMKHKAGGSLIEYQGKVIGSSLIAQKFESDKYFWPRPSANDYNGLSSGGSNLGPTSGVLKQQIEKRQIAISKAQVLGNLPKIPAELLFASGSGLDPHISPEAAKFQVDRIAKSRNLNRHAIDKLIEEHTETPLVRFTGPSYVNVLELNLALDKIASKNGA